MTARRPPTNWYVRLVVASVAAYALLALAWLVSIIATFGFGLAVLLVAAVALVAVANRPGQTRRVRWVRHR